MTDNMKTFAKRAVTSAAVVSMLALAACDEAIMLAPGTVDPNDTCSRFQTAISDARQKENELRVQNAAIGAGIGALFGYIISDGDTGTAIAGAAAGAAIGAGATASSQNQNRAADAEVLRDVNNKAGRAQTLLTDAGKAAASLRSCRLQQIGSLERNVRNGSVSGPEARSQLAVLQRRATVDNRIISASFNGIGQRVDSFVSTSASASGVESAIITRQQAAKDANSRRVASATSNVPIAISTRNRVEAADEQQKVRVENGLREIEVLLG